MHVQLLRGRLGQRTDAQWPGCTGTAWEQDVCALVWAGQCGEGGGLERAVGGCSKGGEVAFVGGLGSGSGQGRGGTGLGNLGWMLTPVPGLLGFAPAESQAPFRVARSSWLVCDHQGSWD